MSDLVGNQNVGFPMTRLTCGERRECSADVQTDLSFCWMHIIMLISLWFISCFLLPQCQRSEEHIGFGLSIYEDVKGVY